MELRKKQALLDYTSKITIFIRENNFEDISHGLIMDYIELLYNKGVDLTLRDVEKEVYNFYGYACKYQKFLVDFGEERFIELIVDEEILN